MHVICWFAPFVLPKFATKNPQELWHLFLALHFVDSAHYSKSGLANDMRASFVTCGFCAFGAAAARTCHIQAEQGAEGSQISPRLEAARS